LSPLRKSSSILSMAVPAFLKWLLHQAVKVWKNLLNYTYISRIRERNHFFVDHVREIFRCKLSGRMIKSKIIKKCSRDRRESQMSHPWSNSFVKICVRD
jgi:hypothetical protein